jgi:hypothetical protein
MTTRELDKLKSKLPRGFRMILRKRIGNVSISAIDKVMRGDYNNDIIIEAAINLAQETQARSQRLKEEVKSL